jgi:phosphoglycolate phosphatase-like HAD superfamily hydrolase
MNVKKILFFDGDGTLWYPKLTKRTQKPHWIYNDVGTKDNYLPHLELTPGVEATLDALYASQIYLVVISANPYSEDIAVKEIKKRLDYFGLTRYFYKYRSSNGGDPKDKARVMLEVLKDLGLNTEDALMIGDSYVYDYLAAKDVGIDAFWIESIISKNIETHPSNIFKIQEVEDLIEILKLVE